MHLRHALRVERLRQLAEARVHDAKSADRRSRAPPRPPPDRGRARSAGRAGPSRARISAAVAAAAEGRVHVDAVRRASRERVDASSARTARVSGSGAHRVRTRAHSEKFSVPGGGAAGPDERVRRASRSTGPRPRARSSCPARPASRRARAWRSCAAPARPGSRPERVGRDVLLEADQQALPPARLRVESWKGLDLARAPAPRRRRDRGAGSRRGAR